MRKEDVPPQGIGEAEEAHGQQVRVELEAIDACNQTAFIAADGGGSDIQRIADLWIEGDALDPSYLSFFGRVESHTR